jgi:hypothetical protein
MLGIALREMEDLDFVIIQLLWRKQRVLLSFVVAMTFLKSVSIIDAGTPRNQWRGIFIRYFETRVVVVRNTPS